MSIEHSDYPDWLVVQTGPKHRTPGGAGFLDRDTLVRKFALHLKAGGKSVTFEVIREMLRFVDRGYSLKDDQISRALAPLYRARNEEFRIPKAPNGTPVRIEGQTYRSARAAAEALGISPQTVLRRIGSDAAEWTRWQKA